MKISGQTELKGDLEFKSWIGQILNSVINSLPPLQHLRK